MIVCEFPNAVVSSNRLESHDSVDFLTRLEFPNSVDCLNRLEFPNFVNCLNRFEFPNSVAVLKYLDFPNSVDVFNLYMSWISRIILNRLNLVDSADSEIHEIRVNKSGNP